MATQDLSTKKQNFCLRVVQATQDLQAARESLKSVADEWNANGYGSGSTSIGQTDINGGGIVHLTPAVLASVITSQGNLETWSGGTGNWTNICDAIAN